MNIFSNTNTLILLAISGIHFYWAFGGKWGIDAVIPTNIKGKKMIKVGEGKSSFIATLIVAFGLLAMVLLHLEKVQLLLPTWIVFYSLKIIAGIFLIRAIGEFKYVGFFKKIKGTKFAINDTKFYSPLCLLLSFNAFMTTFYL